MTKSQRRTVIAAVVFVIFGAYTLWAVSTGLEDSFLIVQRPWGAQFFTDLSISLCIAWYFIARDPGRREAVWPWLLLTLPLGSLSPLLYMVVKGIREWSEPT